MITAHTPVSAVERTRRSRDLTSVSDRGAADIFRLPGFKMAATLNQLWLLGTEYSDKSPALARFYLDKMKLLATRGGITLPESLKQRFCQSCGSLFQIGNCSTQLRPKVKRGRRKKRKRTLSYEVPDSSQDSTKKRVRQKKTNLRRDYNHIVTFCKICEKRSFEEGFLRARSTSEEESILRTPESQEHFTSTPVSRNSSVKQTPVMSKSGRRQRHRLCTARKLQNILQEEDRRKSAVATPNIHDFLSSL